MSINPAGLGMYRSDHFAVTPLVTVSSATTPDTYGWQGNSSSNFAIGNIGMVLNVLQSETSNNSPISISVGIGMNRLVDYNYKYSYSGINNYDSSSPDQLAPTIADIFAQQLGGSGIYPDGNGSLGYSSNDPFLWPAIMGYNGYMISPASDSSGKYWTPDTIGANASVAHGIQLESSGAINEYLFSAGVNISNFLYIGATLGVESVKLDQILTYQEEYLYQTVPENSSGTELSSYLEYANIWQRSYTKGVGVNFKIGAIIRPFEALRIGVAYHTPTAYSLERTYEGDIESLLSNSSVSEFYSSYTGTLVDDGNNSWEFASPSKVLLGASLTVGSFGVISVDYERAWYNSISVTNIPYNTGFTTSDYNSEFSNNYAPTNTLRAGIEIKPLPSFAIRAGGGYSSSTLNNESAYYSGMTPTDSKYIGGGVGLMLSDNTSLDLTYQNYLQNYSSYYLFYSIDNDGDFVTNSGRYQTSIRNHNLVATLGFKF